MKDNSRNQRKGLSIRERGKTAARAVINSLLAIVLVVGLAPGVSFAGDTTQDNSSASSEPVVVEPVKSDPEDTPAVDGDDDSEQDELDLDDPDEEADQDDEDESEDGESESGSKASTEKKKSSTSNRDSEDELVIQENGTIKASDVSFLVKKTGTEVDATPSVDPESNTAYYTDILDISASVKNATDCAGWHFKLEVGNKNNETTIESTSPTSIEIGDYDVTGLNPVVVTLTSLDSEPQVLKFYYNIAAGSQAATADASAATQIAYDNSVPTVDPINTWKAQDDIDNGIVGNVSGATVTYKTSQGKTGDVKTTATVTVHGEKYLKQPSEPAAPQGLTSENKGQFNQGATTTLIGYMSGDDYLVAGKPSKWTHESEGDVWTCTVPFKGAGTADEPKKAKLFVVAVDWAGNVSGVAESNEVTIQAEEDSVSPTLKMDYGTDKESKGGVYYYGKSEVEAGAEIKATVIEENNFVKALLSAKLVKSSDGTDQSILSFAGSGTPLGISVPNVDGAYKLTITGKDGVGNLLVPAEGSGLSIDEETGTYEQSIVVDTEKPTIKVGYKDAEGTDKELTKDGVAFTKYVDGDGATAEVTVDDANFDESMTKVFLNDAEVAGLNWRDGKTSVTLDSVAGQVTENKLKVESTDLAGNVAEVYEGTLKVDRKAPEISVTWVDGKNATLEGKTYYKSRKATITVTDDNFSASGMSVVATPAKPDGTKELNTETTTADVFWTQDSTDSTKHTAEIQFTADCAEASLVVSGKDAFENQTTESTESGSFAILSNPVVGVQFSPEPDFSEGSKTLYGLDENEELVATITVLDLDFATNSVTVDTEHAVPAAESGLTWEGADNGVKHVSKVTYTAEDRDAVFKLTGGSNYRGSKQLSPDGLASAWELGSEPVELDASQQWTKTFEIDATAPLIVEVSYTPTAKNTIVNDKTYYFDAPTEATVKITEKNVKDSTGEPLLVQYKKADDSVFTNAAIDSTDANTHTYKIAFNGTTDEDVLYDLQITGNDLAQHKVLLKNDLIDQQVYFDADNHVYTNKVAIAQAPLSVEIAYKTAEGGKSVVQSSGSLRSSDEIVADVTVHDLFLDPSTTISDTVSGSPIPNQQVTVGESEDQLKLKLNESGEPIPGTYTCSITLDGTDGAEKLHQLKVDLKDKALRSLGAADASTSLDGDATKVIGSVDTEHKTYSADVLIDKAAPVLKVTYNPEVTSNPDTGIKDQLVAATEEQPETRYYGIADFENAAEKKIKVQVSVTDSSFEGGTIEAKWDDAAITLTRQGEAPICCQDPILSFSTAPRKTLRQASRGTGAGANRR